MTKSQAIWASHHDWFLWSTFDYETDTWFVVVDSEHETDINHDKKQFSDFQSLREWAGY